MMVSQVIPIEVQFNYLCCEEELEEFANRVNSILEEDKVKCLIVKKALKYQCPIEVVDFSSTIAFSINDKTFAIVHKTAN